MDICKKKKKNIKQSKTDDTLGKYICNTFDSQWVNFLKM